MFEINNKDEVEVVISTGIKETKATLELSAKILEMIITLQSLLPVPKRCETNNLNSPFIQN